ncbi:MAG: hypothetical protein WKG06_13790 [Segetibacter sp.]
MKSHRFTLKIDDELHSLDNIHGIPIDDVGVLLADLAKAIQMDDSKCVLTEVRSNCYALQFETKDEKVASNFAIVHKNILSKAENQLSPSEKKYANSLLKVLKGGKYFAEAIDNNTETLIATISTLKKSESVKFYYTTDEIYGVITGIDGEKLEETAHPKIKINKLGLKINIPAEKEFELLEEYKRATIRFYLRFKHDKEDGKIVEATLEDYTIVSEKTLSEITSSLTEDHGDFFPDYDSSTELYS